MAARAISARTSPLRSRNNYSRRRAGERLLHCHHIARRHLPRWMSISSTMVCEIRRRPLVRMENRAVDLVAQS